MKPNRSTLNSYQPKSSAPAVRHAFAVAMALAAGFAWAPSSTYAGFASPGQGIQVVTNGTVSNGALFWETKSTWTNLATPAKPYTVEAYFALPNCDAVAMSRLVMTVWGGTANYICNLNVQINGTNLPGASSLTFSTTSDPNAVFSVGSPSVYGSGSGVWLIGLPVPGNMLFKDGAANRAQITVNTPDNFDGRINQVTLLAVYQVAALGNSFEYVVAEGSGDIYRTPTSPQADVRTIPLGSVNPTNANAARFHALYTYGDLNQNDRLYFNGTQYGADDVANYDKSATGLDFGPNAVSFFVLGSLAVSNAVTFSVSATDVPGTRETSLRPQLAVLEVTRPPLPPPPALAIALNRVITWPVSAENYQLEYRTDVDTGTWAAITNVPVVVDGMNTVILLRTTPQQFYQLRKTK